MLVTLICYAIQIILAVTVFKRKDLDLVGKLIAILIIVVPPYMLGAAFYYFYASKELPKWLKK
ncbi:MAG: hypothetical protein J6U52_07875 [Alistipes sp.]|jgi:flagellar biosynthesis protein FliQ|nr:hypothetical protein [Alistipes sp.]